jgi:hypothetical protein
MTYRPVYDMFQSLPLSFSDPLRGGRGGAAGVRRNIRDFVSASGRKFLFRNDSRGEVHE